MRLRVECCMIQDVCFLEPIQSLAARSEPSTDLSGTVRAYCSKRRTVCKRRDERRDEGPVLVASGDVKSPAGTGALRQKPFGGSTEKPTALI